MLTTWSSAVAFRVGSRSAGPAYAPSWSMMAPLTACLHLIEAVTLVGGFEAGVASMSPKRIVTYAGIPQGKVVPVRLRQ